MFLQYSIIGVLSSELRQNSLDDFPVYIGEAIVSPLKSKGQLGVVQSQLMQDGCLEIVNVNFIFGNSEAEFVGLTIAETSLNATASHPDCEGIDVVVASGG